MKKEHLGAFIDAVYAIAITMLALEIPVEIEKNDLNAIVQFATVILQYALSFAILFGIWFKHRLINELQMVMNRSYILRSAIIMFVAALLPRITTLAFEHGKNSGNIFDLNMAEVIDILFMLSILIIDFCMAQTVFKLKLPTNKVHPNYKVIYRLKLRQVFITCTFIFLTISVILLPFMDYRILWLIAVVFFFEEEIDSYLDRLLKSRNKSR